MGDVDRSVVAGVIDAVEALVGGGAVEGAEGGEVGAYFDVVERG
jgi:hypothetical protein